MPLKLSALSTEYVRTSVAGTGEEDETLDPTGLTVHMAVKPFGGTPAEGDWRTVTWTTTGSGSDTTYWSKILVGPGSVPPSPLTTGTYWVWVRIADVNETPVKRAGLLVIF